mmetsp:Transcript_6241/g.9875  ORF Transcript_6241/g.9875 Transcript_6241/m.9875 type:complete len:112 (+) Transcript_6241:749-1084(+)
MSKQFPHLNLEIGQALSNHKQEKPTLTFVFMNDAQTLCPSANTVQNTGGNFSKSNPAVLDPEFKFVLLSGKALPRCSKSAPHNAPQINPRTQLQNEGENNLWMFPEISENT